MRNTSRTFLAICAMLMLASGANAFYDAVLGRFATRDPIGENGGINLYEYVGNNPINLVDPLGLQAEGPVEGPVETPPETPEDVIEQIESGRTPEPKSPSDAEFKPAEPPGCPKPAQNFKPPTNEPQLPPSYIPAGWRVRVMPPTSQYPSGYWRLYNPNGQPVDPSTMQPPGNCSSAEFQAQTHIPLPLLPPGSPPPPPPPNTK
jgi:hypothetical protein